MTDKLVAHNSLNSRCWQRVYERCTRQPAISDDWQAVTERLLFGTSSQLRKHYSACHTWQRHNWITSGAVCAAGATFGGNHGREQIMSARLFFCAVSGHRKCFSHHAELLRGHTNMGWHSPPPHTLQCFQLAFENKIIMISKGNLLYGLGYSIYTQLYDAWSRNADFIQNRGVFWETMALLPY